MRIVIDTNVVVSGIFFGGKPAELLKLVTTKNLSAFATDEIVDEYQETMQHKHNRAYKNHTQATFTKGCRLSHTLLLKINSKKKVLINILNNKNF